MKRRGLGRGLDALLPVTPGAERLRELSVDSLDPNPEQPRAGIDAKELEGLAASIRSRGLIEPIVAREDGSRFQIIAGERRWRAARLAGLERVPVIVREVSDDELGLLALVENLQRQDLNPMEESQAFRRLAEETGLTHQEIASEIGRSRAAVTNALRLLELAPEVRRLIEIGKLRAAAGRALIGLNPATQERLAEDAVGKDLSVREVERRVRMLQQGAGAATRRSKPPLDANSRAAQERMQRAVGLPVTIERRGKGGSLRIRFFSEDDLQRVFLLLTKRQDS